MALAYNQHLHHPVAGKELSGLLVSGWVGELGVNRGVLDIGVAKPVFDLPLQVTSA